MSELTVSVGGMSLSLVCRDGEEQQVQNLAAQLTRRINLVREQAPKASTHELIALAGMTLIDELSEARERNGEAALERWQGETADQMEALTVKIEDYLTSQKH